MEFNLECCQVKYVVQPATQFNFAVYKFINQNVRQNLLPPCHPWRRDLVHILWLQIRGQGMQLHSSIVVETFLLLLAFFNL